jgi:hypothetical protein
MKTLFIFFILLVHSSFAYSTAISIGGGTLSQSAVDGSSAMAPLFTSKLSQAFSISDEYRFKVEGSLGLQTYRSALENQRLAAMPMATMWGEMESGLLTGVNAGAYITNDSSASVYGLSIGLCGECGDSPLRGANLYDMKIDKLAMTYNQIELPLKTSQISFEVSIEL